MSLITVIKSLSNCLLPMVLVIAIELLNKLTPYKKLNKWIKIAIGGALGGLIIFICDYCLGIKFTFDDGQYSVLSLPVLTILAVGIGIDYRSGIIATLIGFFYRVFVIPFSQQDLFRWPISLAIVFACLVAVFMELVISKRKKMSWLFAFFTGVFTQTFGILLVFLFSLDRLSELYSASSGFTIFSILATGISLAILRVIVCLINKESIKIPLRHDNRLAAKVQRRLFIATLFSFLVAFTATYTINYQKTLSNCSTTIASSVTAMTNQVNRSLSEPSAIKIMANEPRIMTQGFYIITDNDSQIVSILDYQNWKEKYTDMYFAIKDGTKSKEIRDFDSETSFNCNWEGNTYVCYYRISSGGTYNVIGLVPTKEIDATVGVAVNVVIYLLIIIFTVLFLLIDSIINRLIVNDIYKINASLQKITAGDLQEIVNVRDSKEFDQLSTDINSTVMALKDYADEINRRLDEEKELAVNIQKNSVVNSFPLENGFDIYASMQNSSEAGGDFYDYIRVNNNKVVLLIADVIGSGIGAVMYMIQAKTYLKSLLAVEENKTINLKAIINKANAEFSTYAMMQTGMAMWIGLLDIDTGELEYINANHINPLIKTNHHNYQPLRCKKNIYLGIDKNYIYEVERVKLNVNDELLLLTDGIENIKNKDNIAYGVNGVIRRLDNINYFTSRQLIQQINEDINRYIDNATPSDDITLLSFRYVGYRDSKPEHEITLKAIPNNTPIATKFVESIMQQYNCSAKSQAVMLIAVDELFSNIAYYAYKDKKEGGNGTIRIEIKDTEFRLILIDNGVPFNPLTHLDPNYINSSAEDRTNKGGLGIFMVRRSVDDMQYKYENGQNILTIVKNIPEMHEEKFKDSYSTTRD